MEQLITVENLHKSYGSKTVLDEVSFTAQPGQIIGLLGPNGCGKTTLIKILTGLIKDHTGTVRINNEEPGAYSKSIVAYLPEKTYLPGKAAAAAGDLPQRPVVYFGRTARRRRSGGAGKDP